MQARIYAQITKFRTILPLLRFYRIVIMEKLVLLTGLLLHWVLRVNVIKYIFNQYAYYSYNNMLIDKVTGWRQYCTFRIFNRIQICILFLLHNIVLLILHFMVYLSLPKIHQICSTNQTVLCKNNVCVYIFIN